MRLLVLGALIYTGPRGQFFRCPTLEHQNPSPQTCEKNAPLGRRGAVPGDSPTAPGPPRWRTITTASTISSNLYVNRHATSVGNFGSARRWKRKNYFAGGAARH